MEIFRHLQERWRDADRPLLVHADDTVDFADILAEDLTDLSDLRPGDVVALIGDFDPYSIQTLLRLVEMNAIVVPLTPHTRAQHPYFFEAALVDAVIEGGKVERVAHDRRHPLIDALRQQGRAGLVLFTTGTTGRPKAILHDMTRFMKRFETPRPTQRTLSFLLFDHIGGINTLFHALFNAGTVVAPQSHRVEEILETCADHSIEVLPTTPTFLRMMLMSGMIPDRFPPSVRVVTYGTERMDQPTLTALCALLPDVDFRQTFGMSELGIMRVKSRSRDSLFMKIGGEGVETRVVDGVLQIRAQARMLGYLNADSPFDADGWYDTKDIVEQEDGFMRVTGRTSEVINVGGLKFMASEVERAALQVDGVELAKAEAKPNPITGQHVEITVQIKQGSDITKDGLKHILSQTLPSHMVPRRIALSQVAVGHRFKRS